MYNLPEEVEHKRKGFEWLESDVEIMNLLLEKQEEGDEILGLFNIQFMDDSYLNEDMEEINRIYVIRDQTVSDGKPSSFEGDGYHCLVEIIIRTSNYNYIQAQQLLKTAVKCIDQHLKLSPLGKWVSIREIVPKYEKPGKLREYRLELKCYEIHETVPHTDLCSRDLRIDLCVQVGVEDSDIELHKIYPYVNRTRMDKIQLHKSREENKCKEIMKDRFGGG